MLEKTSDRYSDRSLYLMNHSSFKVSFLGIVQDINMGGSTTRDLDVQLVDRVEEAQIEGKISLLPRQEESMVLSVSKYGIKVMDSLEKEVVQRHPLYTVAQIVYYVDSFYKSNVAIKIGQVRRSVYDCYVFQCQNEQQAHSLCQSVKDVFSSLTQHTTVSSL